MAWLNIYDRRSTYGYTDGTWRAARERAKQVMIANLRDRCVVLTTYGELVDDLRSIIDFGTPRSPVFHCLLGQIADEEEEQGRGLLSAVVVHKGDLRPGSGFYDGAASWGRDTADPDACWAAELKRLQQQWP